MCQNVAVLFCAWACFLRIAGESSSALSHSDITRNFIGREGELIDVQYQKDTGNVTHPQGAIATQTAIQQVTKILNQTVVDKTETTNVTSSTSRTITTPFVPVSVEPVRTIDLSKPGVLKRAMLVFGGFSLIAVTYFIFYRRRQITNIKDNVNHQSNDPQFRYGMLQSDDKPDRMELSNLPLTMDSDDDDEDLEIFDLGERKKSLSYTTLSTHDRNSAINDIISSARKSSSQERKSELLLDIEDRNTPAVIPVTPANRYEI